MFKSIIEVFENFGKIKEKRFKDFIEFYKECTLSFPEDLKLKLLEINEKYGISVSSICKYTKGESYYINFSPEDIIWWVDRFKTERFLFSPIDKIKSYIYSKCIEAPNNISSEDLSPEAKELRDTVFKDYINGIA